MAHLKAFRMDITPELYRGMHFLGNFKSKEHRNTLSDTRLTYLHQDLFLNKVVLDVGAGDGAIATEIAIRLFP
jgi:2-polyprenyl-3-methyl-5-hydroxy-6-metoxy-1,4-benzoquinol methylase